MGIGDCVCCGERRIGERRILGCTDYNGYVEILWFKTGVTVQFTEAIPEEVVNKFSEYISSEFFDIDLRRYIEKEGLVNVRLYEDRGV